MCRKVKLGQEYPQCMASAKLARTRPRWVISYQEKVTGIILYPTGVAAVAGKRFRWPVSRSWMNYECFNLISVLVQLLQFCGGKHGLLSAGCTTHPLPGTALGPVCNLVPYCLKESTLSVLRSLFYCCTI